MWSNKPDQRGVTNSGSGERPAECFPAGRHCTVRQEGRGREENSKVRTYPVPPWAAFKAFSDPLSLLCFSPQLP